MSDEDPNSQGNRFYRRSYATIVKRLKIDPITEGRLLTFRLNRLLFGSDFLELKSEEERERRGLLADQMIKNYGARFRRFITHYHYYCHARGREKAITWLQGRMPDFDHDAAVARKDRLEKESQKA